MNYRLSLAEADDALTEDDEESPLHPEAAMG